jgi:hypothetical protein
VADKHQFFCTGIDHIAYFFISFDQVPIAPVARDPAHGILLKSLMEPRTRAVELLLF